MAYDVSALNEIIDERLEPIIQVVEEESLFRALPQIDTHVGPCPSTYRATFLIPNVTITGCCEPYKGGGDSIQKDFAVECYKAGDYYCETDLGKIIRNAARKVRYTAGREDAGAAGEYIARANRADFLLKFNRLLLLGDVTSSDTNLNRFDGWITQAIAGGGTQISITSGNLWEAYVQVYMALTSNPYYSVYGNEILMFVPYQYAEWYKLLILSNRMTYPDASTESIIGLDNVTVVPTHALTDQIFATPAKNLVGIMSDRDDEYTDDWDYIKDKEGEYYLWRIKGCAGVGVYDPTLTVIATVDPSVSANTTSTINVNVLNNPLVVGTDPAGANGGLLTDTTAAATRSGAAATYTDQTDPAALVAALQNAGYPVPAALKKAADASKQTEADDQVEGNETSNSQES